MELDPEAVTGATYDNDDYEGVDEEVTSVGDEEEDALNAAVDESIAEAYRDEES